MTEREKSLREKLTERKSLLDDYFRSKYLSRESDGRAFFQSKKGAVFTVDTFEYFGSIVLEYAASFENAPGGWEDGSLHSIDLSEQDMIKALEEEINN